MPGLFEALAKMPKRGPKKHFVTVDGEKYEVPFEKHQWAIQQGFENLMIKNGEIVLKPPRKIQVGTVSYQKRKKKVTSLRTMIYIGQLELLREDCHGR